MKQIANNDNEREETGGNRTGLRQTTRPMGPLTVEHEQWNEFIDALLGGGGCDFHLVDSNDSTSATWRCDGTDAFPIAKRILVKMGLTPNEVEQSISYFMGNGGCCDCEVWLNVDRR
jgi:hypothetical protein